MNLNIQNNERATRSLMDHVQVIVHTLKSLRGENRENKIRDQGYHISFTS